MTSETIILVLGLISKASLMDTAFYLGRKGKGGLEMQLGKEVFA